MTEIINHLTHWLKNNAYIIQNRLDGDKFILREFATGKELTLDTKKITQHRLKQHPQGQGDYLNLIIDNHTEIVLCHAGIAFSPSFVNSGPIVDAPPVVCLSDYFRLRTSLDEIMNDTERKQESLTLFHVLISIIDGAKMIGFNMDREEEELNDKLNLFEKIWKS